MQCLYCNNDAIIYLFRLTVADVSVGNKLICHIFTCCNGTGHFVRSRDMDKPSAAPLLSGNLYILWI